MKKNKTNLPIIKVPIIFHIVRSGKMPLISKALIQSQIDALNAAYNPEKLNKSNIPLFFKDLMANPRIEFFTDRVIYKESDVTEWYKIDEFIKNSKKGGSDIIDLKKYLNVYVCNTIYGSNTNNPILGYAWSPYKTRSSNDGVVVSYRAFGRHNLKNEYNQGKTLVHEIGHYLNLSHIWGPTNKKGATYCRLGDRVTDTPNAASPNFGCPTYPVVKDIICRTGNIEEKSKTNEMFMNYMDYVDDSCMHMFTFGQVARMRATFLPGGGRDRLIK